ncbi:hypothetical protein H2199_005245 [Coniosporium tulheliwenetii]|uniref:Uncharacterized protein n=1 Tax=Coniosporium tulheliwenetii TaxID=3383036 RepID=A0ACC2Z493_9PEZI|nr:hypothetical protein H2199_005245 [Cladosporium sp. JES 115]
MYSDEADTRVIAVDEFNATTLERMLQYLYTLDYDDARGAVSIEEIWQNDREVAKLGTGGGSEKTRDNYNGLHSTSKPDSGMKEPENLYATTHSSASGLSVSSMAAVLITNIDVYAIADYYGITSLKELAARKFDDLLSVYDWVSEGFLDVLQYVYQKVPAGDRTLIPDTNRTLRSTTLQAAVWHIKSLVDAYGEGLAAALNGAEDLSGDLLREVLLSHEADFGRKIAELVDVKDLLFRTRDDLDETQVKLRERESELAETKLRLREARIEPDKAWGEVTKERVQHDRTKSALAKARIELDKLKRDLARH